MTGIYQLRVRVPADLRALVGKAEVVQSYGTRDPAEAERRHAKALCELYTKWDNLRAGPKCLSDQEADELSAPVYDNWMEEYRADPAGQTFWPVGLLQKMWPKHFGVVLPKVDGSVFRSDSKAMSRRPWCLEIADYALSEKGLSRSEENLEKVAMSVAGAMERASISLARLLEDKRNGVLTRPQSVPSQQDVPPARDRTASTVKFETLINGWALERRPAPRTEYEWRRVCDRFIRFLGHDDADRFTTADVIRSKTLMIEENKRPKTIRDAMLAPVRAVLEWGVSNEKLVVNVAKKVTIDVKIRAGEGRRGFSDDEAEIILQASLKASDSVRRWVPWICAYTGGRVSEICQLRREDNIQRHKIWCIKFDPEAGSLKNDNSERVVPIHSALIESGFLTFADSVESGPLFTGLPPDKFGKRGGNGTKVLGKWVRSLNVADPRLAPNHSWRHRMKTSARRHGLATDLVDALTGHARRTVADRYGEYPIEALQREIEKIPAIRLTLDHA